MHLQCPTSMWLLFLLFHFLVYAYAVVSENLCKASVKHAVGNSTGYRILATQLKQCINYTEDPCENFYEFVCKNFIRKVPKPNLLRVALHDEVYRNLEEQEKSMLLSPDFEDSRSAKAVQKYYKKCLFSESEWSSANSSIAFVLRKIRQYGGFPIIDDQLRQENMYDLTDLLVYFNRNSITTVAIVPNFIPTESNSGNSMHLVFQPKRNILTRLHNMSIYYSRERMEDTPEFRLFTNITNLVCKTTKSCDRRRVEKDLLELCKFSLIVNSIAMDYLKERCLNQTTLKEIDKMTTLVNWTSYLNKIRPLNARLISSDMQVTFCDKGYFIRLDILLRMASKRVVTNYVMMMYILAWAEFLDDNYRSAVANYANEVNAKFHSREQFCAIQTWDVYGFSIMLAMFARQNNGQKIEKYATQMTNSIMAEFEHVVRNNAWMDNDSKQALLLKLRNMKTFIAYEDQHFDLKSFDRLLEDYIQEKHFEKNCFLQLKDKFARLKMEEMFHCLNRCKAGVKDGRSVRDLMAAHAAIELNAIEIRPGMFQFPFFEATLPMSFNYGGIGAIIGHEIMHNFNTKARNVDANARFNKQWLGSKWNTQFDKLTLCFLEHYNNSQVLFYEDGKVINNDLRSNASRTLEEDLGDNEGAYLSLMAYRTYLKKHGPEAHFEDMEDFSSDQMFFIGYALKHCARYSWKGFHLIQTSNVHSLDQLRVNKVVANRPEFAEAFHCAPGKRLNPEKRCSIY